jgi:hypothetical protein
MKLSPNPGIDTDATIEFEGEGERDNAWLTINLGPGRPSASVLIVATDAGLGIMAYPLDGELGPAAGALFVQDWQLTNPS